MPHPEIQNFPPPQSGIYQTAREIVLTLRRAGFETYLVGGCVRDLAAGNTAGDIDYSWEGHVSRAHPYQPEDHRIVYRG